ncbi:MAG: hypothetical protein WKF85_00080 [Chitinophagaceae bacterium]
MNLKHKVILASLSIFLILSTTSCFKEECPEQKIKELMGGWYKRKIVFPLAIELLNKIGGDSTYWHQLNLKEPSYFIVHFFMADCDKCVNELLNIQNFIQKHERDKNVKYIFIASGPTKIFVQEAIQKSKFILPVYYEQQYFSFKKINNLPIADRLYNTMLLDHEQGVILFGELFQNKEAEKLFYNTIRYCK